jgi:hypothetical protein
MIYCCPRLECSVICFRLSFHLLTMTPWLWRAAIDRALLAHATARAIEGSALDG